MLKNQSYYPQRSKVNVWDVPTFAGVNTWKEWHGPRMRADAEMMDRLDRFDEDQEQWEARKMFVNTTRVQTLDRFYNRKLQRSQLETSSSWAPHRHSKREVHSSFETFDSGLDEKPEKELKKVLTEKVLKGDREAVRNIAGRMQNEETWKQVFKQMEQERRADIRADLQQRQAHTDRLMMLSGQPVRPSREYQSINNCHGRSEELAKPRFMQPHRDITVQSDFRGLIHADNAHALEALFPGSGHELSVEFRARTTASATPGFPPPPRAETPPHGGQLQSREVQLQSEASLARLSIPTSSHRLQRVATRTHDEMLMKHSKAQFLPNVAPPPPNQSKTLLNEDWSPAATLTEKEKVTGAFARTDHLSSPTGSTGKARECAPPPTRSYVYPTMAPSSPQSQSQARSLRGSSSAPQLITSSHQSVEATLRHPGDAPKGRKPRGSAEGGAGAVVAVCRELDDFEASAPSMPRISNFFATPRATRSKLAAQGR